MSKILIVEDEEALSDPLAFLLGREGCLLYTSRCV